MVFVFLFVLFGIRCGSDTFCTFVYRAVVSVASACSASLIFWCAICTDTSLNIYVYCNLLQQLIKSVEEDLNSGTRPKQVLNVADVALLA